MDIGLLARAWLWLLYVDAALRFMPFQRALSADVSPERVRDLAPADLARARAYARHIDAAARHHVVRARCLHRSLVLHRWLRGERLAPALRIGVRKTTEFSAHAWVELGGEVINDRPDVVAAFAQLTGPAASNLRSVARRSEAPLWQ